MTPVPAQQRSRPTRATAPISAQHRLVIAAGLVGGALLFLDLGLHAFRSLERAYFALASIMALCLPCVPAAFWLRGAIRPGWLWLLATVGTALVVLGAAAWLSAFALLFSRPDLAFTQHLTPGGSALMSSGMVLFGISVLASSRLSGPRATLPLLVGVYFPLQLVAQLMFFLNGKDGAPGPNGLILGAWGLLWAAAAWSAASTGARLDGRAAATA